MIISPERTVLCAACLVTDRSAEGGNGAATVVCSVALLLEDWGSAVELLTVAVLLMLPVAEDATTPRRSVTEEVPFAIVPSAKLPFHACHEVPLLVEYSALVNVDVTLSVSTTEAAALGPLFFTVSV